MELVIFVAGMIAGATLVGFLAAIATANSRRDR